MNLNIYIATYLYIGVNKCMQAEYISHVTFLHDCSYWLGVIKSADKYNRASILYYVHLCINAFSLWIRSSTPAHRHILFVCSAVRIIYRFILKCRSFSKRNAHFVRWYVLLVNKFILLASLGTLSFFHFRLKISHLLAVINLS